MPVFELQIEIKFSANDPENLPLPARGALLPQGPKSTRHFEHRDSPTQSCTVCLASHWPQALALWPAHTGALSVKYTSDFADLV